MVNSLRGRLLAGVCIVLAVAVVGGCRSKAPVQSGMPLPVAAAPVADIPGYLTAPGGGPLRDALGRCWRTADWRPALAIEECDAALARERKLRELALRMSGVASVPEPLGSPAEARFEGAPPPAAGTGAGASGDAGTPVGDATAAPAGGSVASAGGAVAVTSATAAVPSPGAATAVASGSGTGGVAGAGPVAPTAAAAPVTAAPASAVAASPVAAPAAAAVDNRPAYITKPVVLNTDAAFFFGKDRLTVAGKDAVENLAAYIKLWGIEDVQVEVVGHTDRIGSAKDNLVLSRKRAEAVKQVLVDAGVPAGSISATGVGSSQPVTAPDTCPDDIDRCERINCLAPDRRVEVGLRGTRKAPARL